MRRNSCHHVLSLFNYWIVLIIAGVFFYHPASANSIIDPSHKSMALCNNMPGHVDSSKTAVTEAINEVLGKYLTPNQFQIVSLSLTDIEDGAKSLSGSLKVFNFDVVVSGVASKEEKLKTFQLQFPTGAKLNVSSLDKMIGGKITDVVPINLAKLNSVGTSLSSMTFHLEDGGTTVSQFSTVFSSTGFDLLSFNSARMDQVKVELFVDYPTDATKRKVGGKLSGSAAVEDISIIMSADITANPQDIEFTGSIENINFKTINKWAMGVSGDIQLSLFVPEMIQQLKLEKLEAKIKPNAKTFKASAQSSLGMVTFDMIGASEGKPSDMQIAMTPKEQWKFSMLSDVLNPLDELKFKDIQLVIATTSSPLRSATISHGESMELQRGVNFMGSMTTPDKLRDVLKLDQVAIAGYYGSGGSFRLNSTIQFADAEITKGVRFSKIEFGIAMAEGRPSMMLGGRMDVDINSSEMLGLNGEFKLNMAGAEGVGSFWLEALSKNGSQVTTGNELEPAEWRNPFGVPGVTVRKLGVSMGVSPTSPILISSMGFVGDMSLGTASDKSKHLFGKLAMNVSLTDPSGSLIDMNMVNLNLKGFIDAFSEQELTGAMADFTRSVGTDTTQVLIVPRDGILFMGETYNKGIKLKSNFELMGLDAEMSFGVDPTSGALSGKGKMESFAIDEGGFKFIQLTGAKDPVTGETPDRPSISLDLSSSPKFTVNGKVTILEAMTTEAAIEISESGMSFFVKGDIGNGVLKGSAFVQVRDFKDGGIRVKGKLEDNIIESLEKYVENYSENRARDAESKVEQLKKDMASGDAAQQITAAFEFAFDQVKALPQDLAAAGAYLTTHTIGEVINLDSITFDFELNDKRTLVKAGFHGTIVGAKINSSFDIELNTTDMNAFMQQVAEQLGQSILDAMSVAGKAALDGLISQGGAFIGKFGQALMDSGAAVVEWGEYNFTCEGVVAPRNSRPLWVGEGYYHYTITATQFVVTAASDNLGLDHNLEVYGAIFASVPGGSKVVGEPYMNQFFFNRSCDESSQVQRDQGQGFTINCTKHFYVKKENANAAAVVLYGRLRDADSPIAGNAESDAINGQVSLNLGSYNPDGQIHNLDIACGSGDQRINVQFEIRAETVFANIARGKIATQSSDFAGNTDAQKALDGSTDGRHNQGQISITQSTPYPFWQVDLKLIHTLSKITVYNSADAPDRLNSAYVFWSNDPNFGGATDPNAAIAMNQFGYKKLNPNSTRTELLLNSGNCDGRYVRVWLAETNHLQLAEVLIDGKISRNVFAAAIASKDWSDFWVYEQHLTPAERTTYLMDVVKAEVQSWTYDLLKGGAVPDNSHLEEAIKLTRGHYNPSTTNDPGYPSVHITRLLLSYGVRPTNEQMETMMLYRDEGNCLYALDCGHVPNSAMLEKTIEHGKYNIAKEMVKKGTPVSNRAFALALEKNESLAISMIKDYGAMPSYEAMSLAVQNNRTALVDVMLPKVKPNNANLVSAAQIDNAHMFEKLINAGARLNNNDALNLAIDKYNIRIAELCIKNGAMLDPALQYAISTTVVQDMTKKSSMAELMIKAGANANYALDFAGQYDKNLFNRLVTNYNAIPGKAIVVASKYKDLEMVKVCIEHGADPNQVLAEQANFGSDGIVRYLVGAGGDPNLAMMGATDKGLTELVVFLINSGADATNPEIMKLAIQKDNDVIAVLLLDNGSDVDFAIQETVKYKLKNADGRQRIVRVCLERGANPQGCIYRPAKDGITDLVATLLAYGADPDEAILVSCEENHMDIVTLLLDKGANPEKGITAAVNNGNATMVSALIKKGADGSKDAYIIKAAEEAYGDVIVVLLKAGGNPNAKKGKSSALHLAADVKKESDVAVFELIKAGADLDAKDEKGNTPLHLAVNNGRKSEESVNALLKAGASTRVLNNKGDDVLEEARGHKIKKLIKEYRELHPNQ